MTTTPLPPMPPIILQKKPSLAWAFAAVAITLLLVIGIPFAYIAITWSHTFRTAPERLTHALSQTAADALRPKVTIHEIVLNSISDLHKESKLVVFTAEVSTDVTREEGSSSWGVYWGTNTARVAVKNARVQYVIDLHQVNTSDYIYNPEARVMSLSLPKPHVDTSMVAIDPAQIQTLDLRGGWARWDKFDTRDRALAELKPKIITQANAPFVRELAQSHGLEATTQFLQPLASALSQEGTTLKVTYRN